MQIYHTLNKNPDLSIALGYFDGVHLGHKKVIKSAVNYAKSQNKKSAVITFKDHPYCYLKGVCPKYILSREQRQKKIEELGIDYLYELDFNEIYTLTAEEYIERILIKNFSPIAISTGYNHHFGSNRTGSAELLRNNQDKFNYKYFEIPQQKLNGEAISSTAIRKFLQNGDIKKANEMLGYNFSISGKVIKGQQLGRKIGFKTANIPYPAEIIDIPFGAYETLTIFGRSITNFGIRPTVSDNNISVTETHILNFDKDIYNTNLEVEFIKMLRKEQKFNSITELKNQIQSDISKL